MKFVDTAGIRRRAGRWSKSLGIERSYQAMADADVTLVVIDLSVPLEAAGYELVEKARAQGKFADGG